MVWGWTFGKRIAIGFGLSLTMLLVVGAVAYRETDSLLQNDRLVTHTHVVLEELAHLLSSLQDAETGQRGFLLTGRGEFLEPYQAALDKTAPAFADLRRLTIDNEVQQRRLDQLDPLMQH